MSKSTKTVERRKNRRPYYWLGVGLGMAAVAAIPKALAWVFLHPPRHLHVSGRNPRSAYSLTYHRFRQRTTDGIPISGWYVPAPADAPARGVVVICHGYTGNRVTMLPYLPFLHRAGYATILFDFRAHGWSGGRFATFGHREPRDLDAILSWAETHPDLAGLPVALLGESMGASVALLVAAGEPRIRAVVADSPYARFDAAVAGRVRLSFGPLLAPILLPRLLHSGERMLGIRPTKIAPEEAIARIAPRPVLLIHGLADRLLAPENSRRIHAAAPGNATFWEVEGAGHVRAVHNLPEEYGQRVVAFLNESLPLTPTVTGM